MPSFVTEQSAVDADELRIAKPRHLGRNCLGGLLLIAAILVGKSLALNEAIDWPTVADYLLSHRVLDGLWMTMKLTVVSMIIAVILAVIIAQMRLSTNPVISSVSWLYVWFFRGIPLLVLLIIMFNFGLLYPELSLEVPGLGTFAETRTQDLITPFSAAVLAFALQQAAYTSEVIRASLLAVPIGQREAAESLGMTNLRTLRRIVLPQALRIAIPPIANDTINLLKATSLVAFISVYDLLFTVQQIYAQNYKVVPLLVVATIWYLFVVSVMAVGQWGLERRYGRGITSHRVRRRWNMRKAQA
jgi:polar amino acid transport system permease protein